MVCTLWRVWQMCLRICRPFLSPLYFTPYLAAVQMTRAKDKDAKRKAGRKSTFSARKEGILGKFAEIYHQAHSASKPEVALFLNKLANWCISRWGYRQHLNVDIGEEDNDPAEEYDLELSETPDDDLSEAEAETRANYFGELRTVSYNFNSTSTFNLQGSSETGRILSAEISSWHNHRGRDSAFNRCLGIVVGSKACP